MMKNSIGETTTLHYTFGEIAGYKEVSPMLPSLSKFNQSEVANERFKQILKSNPNVAGYASEEEVKILVLPDMSALW